MHLQIQVLDHLIDVAVHVSFYTCFCFSYELLALSFILYPNVDQWNLQTNGKKNLPFLAKVISVERERQGFPKHEILAPQTLSYIHNMWFDKPRLESTF